MKSFQTGRNLYGTLTKNTTTANLSLGDQIANDCYRHMCALKDWYFLHRLRTALTTTSQFVPLPYDMSQVRSVSVVVGTTRYTPRQCPSRELWDKLNQTTYTSDTPEWWFQYDGQLGLFPTPVNAGNTIYMNGKIRVIDLSVSDYTTGSVSAATNGSTTVTGSGTAWNRSMTGRWIRIGYSDADNVGDGTWYEIASVTNATTIVLVRAFAGASIVAGSAAYTIGQMPILPEEFHDSPWYYASALYWNKEDDKRGAVFLAKYTADMKSLEAMHSSENTDMVIDSGEDESIINPNLVINL